MNLIEFLQSTAGLFSGLAAVLGAIAPLLPYINEFRKKRPYKTSGLFAGRGGVSASAVFIILASSVFGARIYYRQELPLNARLTTEAWDALNAGNYDRAIDVTEKCINEFLGAADREQAELESSHMPLPPSGIVSDQEGRSIFARALLNDVATCIYIKGRSEENLGHEVESKRSYQAASKYTYARCWDSRGWFWSPADAALSRF